jgi:hypothetical protein
MVVENSKKRDSLIHYPPVFGFIFGGFWGVRLSYWVLYNLQGKIKF